MNKHNYKVQSLGRMAVFYIPVSKWQNDTYSMRDKTVEVLVEEFLIANYNGFTVRGPFLGYWREKKGGKTHREMVMEIKASFLGKDRIPKLRRFLSGMCRLMDEACVYLETGEDSWLVYPRTKT